MRSEKRVLAIVPARSGSKGIPDKNMQKVGGRSLIARAADTLRSSQCAFVDLAMLSTDSETYAAEGRHAGLECPFLRPPELSADTTSAVATMQQAWRAAEAHYHTEYDVLLIVEPTCPLRRPEDLAGATELLIESGADSVVTVSRLDTKWHPHKILELDRGYLKFYAEAGARVTVRQSLPLYYYRNGACYALTKRALYDQGLIFTERTLPYVIERPLVNIDEPIDLRLAEVYVNEEDSA